MKTFSKIVSSVLLTSAVVMLAAAPASAVQLKYKPLSPSFGGSGQDSQWVEFYNYNQDRIGSDSGQGGQDVNVPDFSELLNTLRGLGDEFGNMPTIIIPVL